MLGPWSVLLLLNLSGMTVPKMHELMNLMEKDHEQINEWMGALLFIVKLSNLNDNDDFILLYFYSILLYLYLFISIIFFILSVI